MTGGGYDFSAHDLEQIMSEKCRLDEIVRFGHRRLRPDITDPDFLVLRARRKILETWIATLPAELDILDVGGRIQPYRALFRGRERSYASCDLQYTALTGVIASAEALPFREASFDVVFSTQVLSYVSSPDLFFRECHRVLRPQGAIIITAPCVTPPQHDERLRILEAGLAFYLREFEAVAIRPEIHSAAGACRTFAQLTSTASPVRWRRHAAPIAICLLNVLGIFLERHFHEGTRLTPNLAAFAKKSGSSIEGYE